MPWTARMLIELNAAPQPSAVGHGFGDTAADAVKDLLLKELRDWNRGLAEVCGNYIAEIGGIINDLESTTIRTEFDSQDGCYPEPWRIVVSETPVDDSPIGDLTDLQTDIDDNTSCVAEELSQQLSIAANAGPTDEINEALEHAEELSRELANTLGIHLQTIRSIRSRPVPEPAKPAHAVKPGGMVFTDLWSPDTVNPRPSPTDPLEEIRALRGALHQLWSQLATAPDLPFPELVKPFNHATEVLKRFPER